MLLDHQVFWALDISSFQCIILGRSSPLKPKNGWGSLVSQA